ncbi:MAG: hypothetical protein ACYDBR_14380 [Gaiellaceae bacterium]
MHRRIRVALGLVAAFVVFIVLIGPVALSGGSGKPCAKTLRYAGATFSARPVAASEYVQSEAIGIGVASGCGTTPANVDIRSLLGISPALAVALPTESSTLYVRKGRCTNNATLLTCLHHG